MGTHMGSVSGSVCPLLQDPVYPAGPLETHPRDSWRYPCSLGRVAQASCCSTAKPPWSSVCPMFSIPGISVDTAQFTPPTLFQFPKRPEDQQVQKIHLLWLLELTQFLFVSGGEVPGDNLVFQSGTVLLFSMAKSRSLVTSLSVMLLSSYKLSSTNFS